MLWLFSWALPYWLWLCCSAASTSASCLLQFRSASIGQGMWPILAFLTLRSRSEFPHSPQVMGLHQTNLLTPLVLQEWMWSWREKTKGPSNFTSQCKVGHPFWGPQLGSSVAPSETCLDASLAWKLVSECVSDSFLQLCSGKPSVFLQLLGGRNLGKH